MLLLASFIVAGALWWVARQLVGELRAARVEASRSRVIVLLELFAPALAAARDDPRAFLVWQPVASSARQLFPAEFAELDRVSGGTFPFTTGQLETAHAQWTADWLTWERAHDAEYKLKSAVAQLEARADDASSVGRAKLDAVELEKLELYQRHYQEYVRVAKALRALIT
jgi:4-amino-4-deoxy-L-arabinose transferase-like glycosyltransferase